MDIRKWKEQYSIGIQRIDYQHKYFLELINWLEENLPLIDDPAMRKRYVREVVQYAQFHFLSEENYMYSIKYGEVESHKKLHAQLIEQLSDHVVRFEFNGQDIPDFLKFLTDWFVKHTVNEDKKIALHLNANAAVSE